MWNQRRPFVWADVFALGVEFALLFLALQPDQLFGRARVFLGCSAIIVAVGVAIYVWLLSVPTNQSVFKRALIVRPCATLLPVGAVLLAYEFSLSWLFWLAFIALLVSWLFGHALTTKFAKDVGVAWERGQNGTE